MKWKYFPNFDLIICRKKMKSFISKLTFWFCSKYGVEEFLEFQSIKFLSSFNPVSISPYFVLCRRFHHLRFAIFDRIEQVWATSGLRVTFVPQRTLMWPASYIKSFLNNLFDNESTLKNICLIITNKRKICLHGHLLARVYLTCF